MKAQAADLKIQLDSAIRRLDLRALALVDYDLAVVQHYPGHLSDMLLQYEVDPETFRSTGIRFASNYVVEQVVRRKAEQNLSDIGNALHNSLARELFARIQQGKAPSVGHVNPLPEGRVLVPR